MSALRDPGGTRAPGVELSVVIAARQAEATLAEQLDALVAQRVPFAWEVVVADNGSTDGTVALARSYADRLRLRVVDASAVPGAGAARNVGVAAARGPLIAFCDADDVVADGWLAAVRDGLREHAFVAGRFEGERLNRPAVLRSRTLPQQDGLQESGHLPGLYAAGAGNMGVRADVFRAVGGFDPRCRFLEDTDLCWRVQLAGVPLVWLPGAVVHVRLRGSLRKAARQGHDYGTGEKWLALRYREQEARLRAVAAERPAVAGAAADALPGPVPPCPDADASSRRGLTGAALTGAALTGAVLSESAAAAAGVLAGGAALGGAAVAGATLTRSALEVHRPGPARAVRRAAATLGGLARVRSLGELGAWCWDLGWGVGYAFGRVEVPEPVVVAAAPPAARRDGVAGADGAGGAVAGVPAPATGTAGERRHEAAR